MKFAIIIFLGRGMMSDINEAGILRAERGQPLLRFGGWDNLPNIPGTPPGKPCSFVLKSFGKVDADCRVAALLAKSVFKSNFYHCKLSPWLWL